MIIIAVILSIITGFVGSSYGYGMNWPELGPVLSIATMGAFIMLELRKNRNKGQ